VRFSSETFKSFRDISPPINSLRFAEFSPLFDVYRLLDVYGLLSITIKQ